MAIIRKMRRQKAVYWGPPVADGDGGFSYPVPVEIDCRWEFVSGVATDPKSHETVPGDTVYVDRDVQENGYLYFGKLDSLSSAGYDDPVSQLEAKRIKGFQKIPNLKATDYLRIVSL